MFLSWLWNVERLLRLHRDSLITGFKGCLFMLSVYISIINVIFSFFSVKLNKISKAENHIESRSVWECVCVCLCVCVCVNICCWVAALIIASCESWNEFLDGCWFDTLSVMQVHIQKIQKKKGGYLFSVWRWKPSPNRKKKKRRSTRVVDSAERIF